MFRGEVIVFDDVTRGRRAQAPQINQLNEARVKRE
jgi:hypothetical protein